MQESNIKKYIYPITSSIFVAVVFLIFYLLIRFLFGQVNLIFQADEELAAGQVVEYQMEEFGKIEKKFKGVVQMQKEEKKEVRPTGDDPKGQNQTKKKAEKSAEEVPDKKSLSIQVLNGRGVRGLAAGLKKKLETQEFLVKSIGNASRTQKTTLKIKESKKDFIDMLKEASETSGYKILKVETLTENSNYDAVIVIGKE